VQRESRVMHISKNNFFEMFFMDIIPP